MSGRLVLRNVLHRGRIGHLAPATAGRTGYPGAFTLLEVLLSLSLASLVLVALGMAVDFQWRVVDRGRGDVEEAQLARVLLSRMANDLRGAIPYDPLDIEGLVAEVMASTAESAEEAAGEISDMMGGEGAGDSALQGNFPEGGSDDSSQAAQDSTLGQSGGEGAEEMAYEEESGTGQSALPRTIPGVYGESDWLQVDVGRLPRLDQFDYLLTTTEDSTIDRLSDVKTVTYYVIPPDDDVDLTLDPTEATSGLVRRELDRAASAYAGEAGQPNTDSDATPLSPEVSAIAFRYHDGTEWVDSWDSDEMGSLPVAVEITITIMDFGRRRASTTWQRSSGSDVSELDTTVTRTLIVHLRAAEVSSTGGTTDETYEDTEATTETTESASGQSDSSSEEPTR